jgi:hypothetical protein
MKPIRVYTDFGVWPIVFGTLIVAVICDGVGVWMGWIAMH